LLFVGAGGLGGAISRCAARKGFGRITVMDGDSVELSNLNRQLFYPEDLYRNKALSLAKNLVKEAMGDTVIRALPFNFIGAVRERIADPDVVICGVDNDGTRVEVARHFLRRRPVVFVAVDETADHGYVFVQEPGRACIACALPWVTHRAEVARCTPAGAVIDILEVVAGFVAYAIDSLLMPRPRGWNYRQVRLSGFGPEVSRFVERRPDCDLCSVTQEGSDAEPA
jgi:molybdopterin/thiamine biosynthesis adenylyltransferase